MNNNVHQILYHIYHSSSNLNFWSYENKNQGKSANKINLHVQVHCVEQLETESKLKLISKTDVGNKTNVTAST